MSETLRYLALGDSYVRADSRMRRHAPTVIAMASRSLATALEVESIVGEQQLAEADDVPLYEKYLELLCEASWPRPRGGSDNPAVTPGTLRRLRNGQAIKSDRHLSRFD